MKRFHVNVSVTDLDKSVRFYTTLFGAEPTVRKPEYAKWMLEDPRVNFSIGLNKFHQGIEHLGIQAETEEELQEVYSRLQQAEGEIIAEGPGTCCYSQSEKSWIADPEGIEWEAFYTQGEATIYGGRAPQEERTGSPTRIAAKGCCQPA